MTENTLNETTDPQHAQMASLLPWYVNGSLNPAEQAVFQDHLAKCKLCQQELAGCQALAGQIPATEEIWQPSPIHFAKILAQVEELESAHDKQEAIHKQTRPGFFHKVRTWFSDTPNPVRWTLTLETLALASLALFVLIPHSPVANLSNGYETLSNTEPALSKQGEMIRLVLADDLTSQELSDLLQRAKAQIRQGPSTVGSYTVEVPAEAEEQALKLMRNNPKIKLAQPIAP